MNWVIPQSFGAISKRFRETPVENTLAAGIPASFGIISYKGRTWAVRYRGNVTHILAENGRDPAFSIEICLLKSSPAVSKTFYEQRYVEGNTDAPDCMSTNGVIPDANSPKKQSPTCATCRNNVWGSRLTPDGKAAKACADNKRLAVVLMPNMLDERFGGPLLLRVPPASLQDLASYGNALAQHGYHEHSIVTRVAFDLNEAYPRFIFSPVRPLSDNEADIAIDLRQSAEVSRILAEALEYVSPAEQQAPFFEQQQQPAPAPAAAPAPRQRAPRQPQTIQATAVAPAVPASQPAHQSAPNQQSEPTVSSAPTQASEPHLASAPTKESDPTDGIPAFLRRQNGGAQEDEGGDDAFLDEIDQKLAGLLPS